MSSVRTVRVGLKVLVCAVVVVALVACSGGGSDSGVVVVQDLPVVPVAPGTLTLTGVVAKGAAIAGAAVVVTCQSGTGTATSATNGSFTITIAGGTLPCAAKATGTDGVVLHSVAQGSGGSATVNISPLTELVVAKAIDAPASTLYANFDAAAQAKVSASALTQATSVVATALQSVTSLAGVDPIKDTLVAGSGTGLDGKLDQLGAALTAAKLSLADLSAAIVANGAAAAPVVAQVTQPAAANCTAFRSGAYAILSPGEPVPADRAQIVSVNAATGALSVGGVVVETLTPVAGKPCQYTDGVATTVISPAGIGVSSEPTRLTFAIPVQALAVAELAGTWNIQGFETGVAPGPFVNAGALVTFDANGNNNNNLDCVRLLPCVADPVNPNPLTINPAGGFDLLLSGGTDRLRFFALRTASGDLSMFAVSNTSSTFYVVTRQKALTLPSVGQATAFWDLTVSSAGAVSTFSTATTTVTAGNAAAGTFTRSRDTDGRVDTFAINSPRAGLRYRALNSCTNASGAPVACSGVITMPLPGTGVVVYGSAVAGTDFFGVSVNRP